MPVRVPVAPLPTQLSAGAPETVVEDGPSTWVFATHLGDLDGASGSWLWPGSDLAVWQFGKRREEN